MEARSEAVLVTSLVVDALEAAGVLYAVGGSLASSYHGVPRSSHDADLVAALGLGHVDAFASGLGEAFYSDPEMMRDAIRRADSFNVVHLETMFKVDVFVAGSDELARQELVRRVPAQIEGADLFVASAEDIVVQKLRWYRKGGEVSERQWSDVLGVLRVARGRLDLEYVREWAERAGVSDLLHRAIARSETA